MWGARIFEEAKTASTRRSFRGSKRRITRRKERIKILQSLILDDMEKEAPNFFQRLKETANQAEDKTVSQNLLGVKHNLFCENGMSDKEYYKKYPTIYHLRKELIQNKEKIDIRFVYLALHHIIKYRGNFLHEGDFAENTNEVTQPLDTILEFLEKKDITITIEREQFFSILAEKGVSKANKKELLLQSFHYSKDEKAIITNMVNAILGYSFDLNKIFDTELEKSKISFATEIENEEEIKENLQDNAEIYDSMNTIYSWYVLQDILRGKQYLSEGMVEKYEKYNKDLNTLKQIYKIYFKSEYKSMFRQDKPNNYVQYNGKNQGKTNKKCKPEDFFTTLKKKINTLPDSCNQKEEILQEIENQTFLSKINITDNGAIPYQLHKKELVKILENQEKYYPTLKENKDKIIQLLEFRIPYYVGPLAKEAKGWAWIVRKSKEAIRPWNFSEVVDEDATAEAFIRRMTNKCTYLINEDVIPKQSILYSKYCVLNEINNIKINGKPVSKDLKKKMIEKLFQQKKKVTVKQVKELVKKEEGKEEVVITGLIDGNNFMSNMAAYIDLKEIFGKIDETNLGKCEKIIYWLTIFEDKKMVKRKIKKEYPEITEEQINKIAKKKYTGWSRLSKELLLGLKANDGESIMEKLEKTSDNFMQIINKKEYGFMEKINALLPEIPQNITYQQVDEIPTSPANKRAIWQTICVVKEIVQIMKCEPQNIYIEFARNEEKEKQMKLARAKQLLQKYQEIESQLQYLKDYDSTVYKQLKKHQNDKEISEKMYLYYIQNGKCLYSGRPLDIDQLHTYQVDHIIPQSYIKDDSIDNKALVMSEENQRKKDSLLLDDSIINARQEWWKSLHDNGLISPKKYFNLIRRKMFETDADRENFVQRQLVETRQITKYVTNLLVNAYQDTEVFAIRAHLTHGFRQKYKLYKNRNINHYHHAQDSYIVSVIGNILNNNRKYNDDFKYAEYVKKYLKQSEEEKEENKYGIIIGMIKKNVDVPKVKKIMQYKDCYISRMLEEQTGEFYNQTLYGKNKNPVIPLKENKPVEKYGGYSGENKAYYTIFSYISKKGTREYQLIGIPIQTEYKIKVGKETLENYIKQKELKDKEYQDFRIVKKKILKNQEYLDQNNEPMRLCSDVEIRVNKELIVNEKMQRLIYLMNQPQKELTDEEIDEVKSNFKYMYEFLLDKLEKEYKVFENIWRKLKEKDFDILEEVEKKATINGLIDLMQTGQGNLKAIGLTDREGRKSGQSFKTERLLNMTFIDKSVTGMYEKRSKIEDGLEDDSSK